MTFIIPDFPRDGRPIGDNHESLLIAHGLLDEGAPNHTVEMAEQALARILPSYTFGNMKVEVGPKKYKTASLVWGLYKLHLQRNRTGRRFMFTVGVEDSWTILSFMTDAVINQAKANPGDHPFVDYVLDCLERNKLIELGVYLAEVD